MYRSVWSYTIYVRSLGTYFKTALVLFVSVFITTFSIDATESFRISESVLERLSAQVFMSSCGDYMVLVSMPSGDQFCVDQYEEQVGPQCQHAEPGAVHETAENFSNPKCIPTQGIDALPWRFVSYTQAEQLCARAGKQLISSAVWYRSALGTSDLVENCALDSVLAKSGSHPECVSGVGAYDLVGNVWEHVYGSVQQGSFEGMSVATSGYVAVVNENGIPVTSAAEPNVIYGSDYMWSQSEGNFTMLRGGFYGSRTDGGIYTVHAHIEPGFGSGAIGFRCMKPVS